MSVGDNGGENIQEDNGISVVETIDEIVGISLGRLILTGKTRNAFQ